MWCDKEKKQNKKIANFIEHSVYCTTTRDENEGIRVLFPAQKIHHLTRCSGGAVALSYNNWLKVLYGNDRWDPELSLTLCGIFFRYFATSTLLLLHNVFFTYTYRVYVIEIVQFFNIFWPKRSKKIFF